MNKTVLILLCLVLVLSILYFCFVSTEYKLVKSTLNGKSYSVKHGNQASADALAQLEEKVKQLLFHLKNLHSKNPDEYYFYPILNQKFTQNSSSILSESYSSNTIDKESIQVCLKTRDSHSQLYSTNLLMYVLLHELAHLCNYHPKTNEPIVGHGSSFVYIFQTLVNTSIQYKLYNYVDYSQTPQEYCGIILSSSVV